jgi:predicted peptidase
LAGWLLSASGSAGAETNRPLPSNLPPAFHTTRELALIFEEGYFTAKSRDTTGSESVLPYRLFCPTDVKAQTKYPLIVWIHGFGPDEVKHPNIGQLNHLWLIFPSPSSLKDCHFFLLAPQNSDSATWHPDLSQPVVDLIGDVVAKHPVDTNRITMVGISSGGTASWEFATRNPDLFAAIAPLASFSNATSQDINTSAVQGLERITHVPVWSFHSQEDGYSPEADRRVIEELQSLGGRGALTLIPWKDHNCWSAAFSKHGLLNWLLAQRKDSQSDPPPVGNVSASRSSFVNAYWPQCVFMLVVLSALVWRFVHLPASPSRDSENASLSQEP